jgi:neutral ceramidase
MRGNPTKTVPVIRFEATDGRPIAVYCNYAVHAVLNTQLDQICGDKGSIVYGADRAFDR